MNPAEQPPNGDSRVASMLGVGFDGADGEVRLSRGPNFALVGGSRETHEQMQETVCKVNETLKKRGKRLQDASREEVCDIFQEVAETLGTKRDRSDENGGKR